jgi:hypothetical protein
MSYKIRAVALSTAIEVPLSRQNLEIQSRESSSAKKSLSLQSAYSESRGLQPEVESFLFDYFNSVRSNKETDPAVDSDGFTKVRTGFKAAEKTQRKSDLPLDFYKFQLKERKIKEWRQSQAERESSVVAVESLRKRQRFNL